MKEAVTVTVTVTETVTMTETVTETMAETVTGTVTETDRETETETETKIEVEMEMEREATVCPTARDYLELLKTWPASAADVIIPRCCISLILRKGEVKSKKQETARERKDEGTNRP